MDIHIDFETRSTLDIKETGAWKYAAHPSTSILCLAVGFGKVPVRVYSGPELAKQPFKIGPEDTVYAHNASFEFAVWYYVMHKRLGWPMIKVSQWRDTMAMAAACALPLPLESVGSALDIQYKKDVEGGRAMLKCCKPVKFTSGGEPLWHSDIETYRTLFKYCRRDVEAERELAEKLPPLSPYEQHMWEITLLMNIRGIGLDVEFAKRAIAISEFRMTQVKKELFELTGGAVEAITKVAGLKRWIAAQGVEVDSLDKTAIQVLLSRTDIPEDVRKVLALRRDSGKSSVAKFQRMLDVVGARNRLRGLFFYHAAAPGRWGGRDVQPHNFPRGEKDFDVDGCIKSALELSASEFVKKYPDALNAISNCLRSTLMAAPGRELVCADYSAIEARVNVWQAGDSLAVLKYRQGVDTYVDMAEFIYGHSEINKTQRALGKAIILGCGYQMGALKFRITCDKNGVELGKIEADAAFDRYLKSGKKVVVKGETWTDARVEIYIREREAEKMAERAVKGFREKYRKVVESWYAQERAVIQAISIPRQRVSCGKVVWVFEGLFLNCVLPSGRYIRYFKPSLKTVEKFGREKTEIRFWGVDSRTKQFKEEATYGGKLVENIVQAIARDIMAHAMERCESKNIALVATVHDELLAEVPVGALTAKQLGAIMCELPKWAKDCPITAEGWRGPRYKK